MPYINNMLFSVSIETKSVKYALKMIIDKI